MHPFHLTVTVDTICFRCRYYCFVYDRTNCRVKRGRHCQTGQYVALKVMRRRPEDYRSATDERRLREEIAAMQRVGGHPHTVGLLEHSFATSYPKRDGSTEVTGSSRKENPEQYPYVNIMYLAVDVRRAPDQDYLHALGTPSRAGRRLPVRSCYGRWSLGIHTLREALY